MENQDPASNRDGFEIAIFCALSVEFDAIDALLEEDSEHGRNYGKAQGDPMAYRTGKIGSHKVVIALLPEIGKRSAAATATWLLTSFRRISLSLVVGVCGGVPYTEDGEEIILGDIIISTGVVELDLGRQLPNEVRRKDTLATNLSRPSTEMRSFLKILGSKRSRGWLRQNALLFLDELCTQTGYGTSRYPGENEDKLYNCNYRHKHQEQETCTICAACNTDLDPVCSTALVSSCAQLGCSDEQVVNRERLQTPLTSGSAIDSSRSYIHFGQIASGDLVIKSASHRDQLATSDQVIGFEMEGAGVWETIPTVVIKGVCDYADSHKNKIWQKYAAAAAATCAKAFLLEWKDAGAPLPHGQTQNMVNDVAYQVAKVENGGASTTLKANGIPEVNPQQENAALAILSKSGKDFDTMGANQVLLWAAKCGTEGMIDYSLARGASVNVIAEANRDTALHIACRRGDIGIAKLLVERGAKIEARNADSGLTPLLVAAANGHGELMQELVSLGADVHAMNQKKSTALIFLIRKRPKGSNDTAMTVDMLIDKGIDINAKDVEGYTALHAAVDNQDFGAVDTLLNYDAKKDIPCKGWTAAGLALRDPEFHRHHKHLLKKISGKIRYYWYVFDHHLET